jgi:hypothetical protein
MIGLAQFILRGRSQAVMVISVFALLPLAIPVLAPLMIISGAALSLVALSHALNVTLTILGLACLFCAAVFLALGVVKVSYALLIFWIPILVSAEVLRRSKNLALAVLTVLLIVIAAVLIFFAIVPDPALLWTQLFDRLMQVPELASQVQIPQQELGSIAKKMTGFVASSFLMALTACLLIGRWWQGRLVNPGGFRREFLNLRLGRMLSVVAIGSIVVATFLKTQLSITLSAVLVTVYLFQGLAVFHAFVGNQPKSKIWLAVFYMLLLLFREIVVMVSLWGLVDAWLDSRRRWLNKPVG